MFTSRCLILFLTCLFPIAASCQTAAHSAVDTSVYAILNYDSSVARAMYKFNKVKPATLSIAEVNDMEQLIDSAFQDYNTHNPYSQLAAPLSGYKRQYVAVINRRGQKEVWINFFCSEFDTDWRHHVLLVNDGGSCYFHLRINLSSRKAGKIFPNGVA